MRMSAAQHAICPSFCCVPQRGSLPLNHAHAACLLTSANLFVLARSYEKRHTNVSAHISPCFRCKEGDTVVIGQCRPLSKTVRFNVLRVMGQGAGGKKGFTGF